MTEKEGYSRPNIGFLGVLTLIFITLKLTGHIDWSWWWVLAPIWIPVALILGLLTMTAIIVVVDDYINGRG